MNSWKLDEDRRIADMRLRGIPTKIIAREIDRSPIGVSHRLQILGLRITAAWSPHEDETIRALYRTSPVNRWVSRLPGRSEGSVHARAHRLGMARNHRVWGD